MTMNEDAETETGKCSPRGYLTGYSRLSGLLGIVELSLLDV
jgi:hypothetical protein